MREADDEDVAAEVEESQDIDDSVAVTAPESQMEALMPIDPPTQGVEAEVFNYVAVSSTATVDDVENDPDKAAILSIVPVARCRMPGHPEAVPGENDCGTGRYMETGDPLDLLCWYD